MNYFYDFRMKINAPKDSPVETATTATTSDAAVAAAEAANIVHNVGVLIGGNGVEGDVQMRTHDAPSGKEKKLIHRMYRSIIDYHKPRLDMIVIAWSQIFCFAIAVTRLGLSADK